MRKTIIAIAIIQILASLMFLFNTATDFHLGFGILLLCEGLYKIFKK